MEKVIKALEDAIKSIDATVVALSRAAEISDNEEAYNYFDQRRLELITTKADLVKRQGVERRG